MDAHDTLQRRLAAKMVYLMLRTKLQLAKQRAFTTWRERLHPTIAVTPPVPSRALSTPVRGAARTNQQFLFTPGGAEDHSKFLTPGRRGSLSSFHIRAKSQGSLFFTPHRTVPPTPPHRHKDPSTPSRAQSDSTVDKQATSSPDSNGPAVPARSSSERPASKHRRRRSSISGFPMSAGGSALLNTAPSSAAGTAQQPAASSPPKTLARPNSRSSDPQSQSLTLNVPAVPSAMQRLHNRRRSLVPTTLPTPGRSSSHPPLRSPAAAGASMDSFSFAASSPDSADEKDVKPMDFARALSTPLPGGSASLLSTPRGPPGHQGKGRMAPRRSVVFTDMAMIEELQRAVRQSGATPSPRSPSDASPASSPALSAERSPAQRPSAGPAAPSFSLADAKSAAAAAPTPSRNAKPSASSTQGGLLGVPSTIAEETEPASPAVSPAASPAARTSQRKRPVGARAQASTRAEQQESEPHRRARANWTSLVRQVVALRRLASLRAEQGVTQGNAAQADLNAGLGTSGLPPRIADYFMVFGPDVPLRELWSIRRSLPGQSSRQRKARVKEANQRLIDSECRVRLFHRYPTHDHSYLPLDPNWSVFGFPSGLRQCIHLKPRPPQCYFAVMTLADGAQLFATYVRYSVLVKRPPKPPAPPSQQLRKRASKVTPHVPPPPMPELYVTHALCLVSHYPLFFLFKKAMSAIYRVHSSASGRCKYNVPAERYVAQLVDEVPLPEPGSFQVSFCVEREVMVARFPCHRPVVLGQSTPSLLLRHLSPENIISVLSAFLTECRVIFTCSSLAKLTVASQAVLQLLYPLQWWYAYIPVLAENMLDAHQMPQPFCLGIHSQHLARITADGLQDNVVVVDLDHNSVTSSTPQLSTGPPLKEAGQLWHTLRSLVEQDAMRFDRVTSDQDEWTQVLDQAIRKAVLLFLSSILTGYRKFLFFINEVPFFNAAGFIQSKAQKDPMCEPFMKKLVESRSFDVYLEEDAYGDAHHTFLANGLPLSLVDELVRTNDHLPTLEVARPHPSNTPQASGRTRRASSASNGVNGSADRKEPMAPAKPHPLTGWRKQLYGTIPLRSYARARVGFLSGSPSADSISSLSQQSLVRKRARHLDSLSSQSLDSLADADVRSPSAVSSGSASSRSSSFSGRRRSSVDASTVNATKVYMSKIYSGSGLSDGQLEQIKGYLKAAAVRQLVCQMLQQPKQQGSASLCLTPPAFKALSDLLRCLLDICTKCRPRDYRSPTALLDAATVYFMEEAGGKRVYLESWIKMHRLWHDLNYWRNACDVAFVQYRAESEQPSSADNKDANSEEAADHEFILQWLIASVHQMLSFGVDPNKVLNLVYELCHKYGLPQDMQNTIRTFYDRIRDAMQMWLK